AQFKSNKFIQQFLLCFIMDQFFFIGFIFLSVQSVKVLVTGFFELFPNLVAILSGHMTNVFPIFLNFFHQGRCGLKIFTVFTFLRYFYKRSFLFKIGILFLFLIFVKAIFLIVEVARCIFKSFPDFFIVVFWNSSRTKKSVSKFLNLFNGVLPALVAGFCFFCYFFYFFNQLFFSFIIGLKILFKFL